MPISLHLRAARPHHAALPCLALLLLALISFGCTCPTDATFAEAEPTVEAEHDAGTRNALASDSRRSSPLVLGSILDFTGALAEHGTDARLGAELAVEHVNRAGGVLGKPVEIYFADGATHAGTSVKAAKKLLTEKRIHAIVGPMGSEATLHVAAQISAPHRLPTVSPSATAPELTTIEDGGFVFRATASDAAQGPVLARLAHDEGYERVGVLYRDDAYGRGLFEAFTEHFQGQVDGVGIDPESSTYQAELRHAAARDAQVLLVLSFPLEAGILVSEAIEFKLFDRFLFADGVRSLDLLETVGIAALEGMKGTSPALRGNSELESRRAFLNGFKELFGRTPRTGPAPGTYDAVICLTLAAEYAGSVDGAAIRDALPVVCGGDGAQHSAGAEQIAAAFKAVRSGERINYDGAGSTVDWNAAGDVVRGLIDVWQYKEGAIASLEQVPFELGG